MSKPAGKTSLSRQFMKNWYAVEALPIIVIVGGIVGVAGFYGYRLAMGPTVIWTKANPTPWNEIQQDQGTKLIEVNHKFDKSWSRDKL
ncbi:hypothetical protein BDZ89DRAFT_1128470 [Hymenopellis radicata]|nr:hypothetical protein BDZ89DRAFT_1128470 [Hymenopellis radicata]